MAFLAKRDQVEGLITAPEAPGPDMVSGEVELGKAEPALVPVPEEDQAPGFPVLHRLDHHAGTSGLIRIPSSSSWTRWPLSTRTFTLRLTVCRETPRACAAVVSDCPGKSW